MGLFLLPLNRRFNCSGTGYGARYILGAAAVEAAVKRQEEEAHRLMPLRDKLYADLCAHKGGHASIAVPATSTEYLPHVVNVHVDGQEGPTLVLRSDNEGFAVSGGSACSSGSLDPSRVLLALGIKGDAAQGELRVSMGGYTSEADIDAFIEAFPRVIGEKYGR